MRSVEFISTVTSVALRYVYIYRLSMRICELTKNDPQFVMLCYILIRVVVVESRAIQQIVDNVDNS